MENNNIKIDDDEILLLLDKVKFELNTNKETYNKEILINNYINNLFNTINNIEEYWNITKNKVKNYIDDFINIPYPKEIDANLSIDCSIKARINSKEKNVKIYSNILDNNSVKTINNQEIINVLEYNNESTYAKIKLENGNIFYVDKNNISIM